MIHSVRLWRSDLMWHLAYTIGTTRHHIPFDSFRAAIAAYGRLICEAMKCK